MAGYTLFELLVVLTIVGLLGGLALPALPALYDRLTIFLSRDDVLREIESLPSRMFAEGSDGILDSQPNIPAQKFQDDRIVLDLPDGWAVEVNEPIHYRHDGTCSGGSLLLIAGQVESRYDLLAPYCNPRPADQ